MTCPLQSPMNDSELQRRLSETTRFGRLLHLSSCGSTQDVAAGEPLGDVVVWADAQDAGRGRQGRSWLGAPGKDVEVTFRARVPATDRPARLAPILSTGIVLALESLLGEPLVFDWPNDVMHRGRKLAGILIDAEGSRELGLLIGVGVNVNRTSFPPELLERATSLALGSGRMIDREDVVLRLAQSIDESLRALAEDRLREHASMFKSRLGLADRRVRAVLVSGEVLEGDLESLDLDDLRIRGRSVSLALIESLSRA